MQEGDKKKNKTPSLCVCVSVLSCVELLYMSDKELAEVVKPHRPFKVVELEFQERLRVGRTRTRKDKVRVHADLDLGFVERTHHVRFARHVRAHAHDSLRVRHACCLLGTIQFNP